MTLCVAMLIAAEFMPVSLLTPLAADLHASEGMAGQAIGISGLFAVITSLFIAALASRLDRRWVLVGLTAVMVASLMLIALAPSFSLLMLARALLGITIGGFWSLATATVMQLVRPAQVPRALGLMYLGNAAATALAAPIGSYLGARIGWRGVFWGLVPWGLLTLAWQLAALPRMPPSGAISPSRVFGLLRRAHVRTALLATMLTFAGAFAAFTYLRPFLEARAHVSPLQLSLLLLALGGAGFLGTSGATKLLARGLHPLLWGCPLLLAAATSSLVISATSLAATAAVMAAWGALNAAVPVAWFNWLAQQVQDEPESAGGLMVGAIQLAIMAGAFAGGLLLDHVSVSAPLIGGALLLLAAAWTAASPHRLRACLAG
jgi:predicted MFS family arabinose efflux permease